MADTLIDKWDKAFRGLRAIITQSYTEANVKNGLQYEASGIAASLAAGANFDVEFQTGAKPVIVKGRQISFTGTQITATVFEAPTTSGGSAATVYNLNRINPVATTCTVKTGITVSATGTQISAPTYGIGSAGTGNSVNGTYAVDGAERVLKPNTKYLLRITNNDAATQKAAAIFSWYEGTTDLPEA